MLKKKKRLWIRNI